MLLSIVVQQSEDVPAGAVRHLSILGAFTVCPIYVFYTLKAQETSIRQVPVSAAPVYSSQEPLCLILNHGETVHIPQQGGSIKSQP